MPMNQHHLCFVLPDEPDDEDEFVDVTPLATPSRVPPPQPRRRAFLEILVHSSVYRFFETKFIRVVKFRQPKKLVSSVYLDTEGVQILEKFGGNSNPRNFSYSELYIGSKGFSKEEILGSGGFGRVYRAVLPSDGSVVAVKCLAERGDKFEKTFAAELLAMAHLRHRNLVSLRGWCLYDDQLFLVYDYMPNSSLDRLLFRQKGSEALDWDMRVKIVNGLAAALFYLHEQLETQIIHRDVKASNVMLDSEFNARLGDFGLARWLEHEIDYKISAPSVKHEKQFLPPNKFRLVDTTRIGGTIGYLPPENFQRHGSATAKADVFSFGIVVLEIVAGRKAVDLTHQDDRIVLLDWVRKLSDEGFVLKAGDRRIAEGSYKGSDMEHLIHLGLLCTLHEPQSRPNMKWVMEVLSGNLCGKLPALPSFKHYPEYISISSKDTDTSNITTTGPSSATFTITTNTTDSVLGDSAAYFTAKGETLYASAEASPSRNGRYRSSKAMPLINIPREVSFKEIVSLTHNFAESHKLAEVGFGTSYHGFLDKTKHVMVKRLGTTPCPQVRSRFSYELENLGKLRHRNLVQLRGWCIENGEMLALYDFNATSLLSHSLLHPGHRRRNQVLQWHQRYSIVKSLASAICYLHEEWDEQVIHKNINSSSIYLDSDNNPRLGNFALAQFLTRIEEVKQVAPQKTCGNDGMFGYMSPEYIINSKATTMSDVYSFGMVVLEVVSGQMAVDFSRPEPLLIKRVNDFETRKRRYEDFADHRLDGQYNHKELVRLVKLGMACTRSDPKERPSIKSILSILNGYDRCFLEKGLKKERKEEWKHNNSDSLSLVKRIQALGIQ
ncbi:Receptor like protein kinase S.2 [Heracleum sosnowskyi]|uniref:Receptor like protein kinase S.2 n=1 Tax=Heracleum sosnowskyi TaxID=360622 RepID=A0AAD8IA27_9APIA|nr:Receptor like protein kinase S.2 [Heracleum sosnowskyi]